MHLSKQDQIQTWRKNAEPLEKTLVEKMYEYFKTFRHPNRIGAHGNSAFSMAHAFDYAKTAKNDDLRKAISKAAKNWFLNDQDCTLHLEPSGGDFVSPCLAVAHLMGKVLSKSEFQNWIENYLPEINKRNAHFFSPAYTNDIKDPVAGHLVGLTFQKAWSFQSLIEHLPTDHHLISKLHKAKQLHFEAGLKQMFDTEYGGSHWLASFAIHAISQIHNR